MLIDCPIKFCSLKQIFYHLSIFLLSNILRFKTSSVKILCCTALIIYW